MTTSQFLEYQIANEHVEPAKERLRQEFPTVLIGTKPIDAVTTLLWVTLFALEPATLDRVMGELGGDRLALDHRPVEAPSLSDLVARVQQQQSQG